MGKLSDVQIRAWIKAGERFEGRADGGGLYLRFRDGDKKPRWRFRYRLAGKPRMIDLGGYGTLSLAEARRTAERLAASVKLGHDVAGEKQERKREAVAKIEADANAWTVGKLADDYFQNAIVGRWKHPDIVRARIENDIRPHLGTMKLRDVRPTHIDAMLKAIVKRGAPTMANDVLRWVKRMFDYAIKRERAETNPAAAFNVADAGGKEDARERWLSRDELAKLFQAMRDAGGVFAIANAHAVRLLLMLAVRKEELIAATWREFDLDAGVWALPAERTKTGAAIDIPLPERAVETLRELHRMAGGSAYVFPARKAQTRQVPHIDMNTLGAALNKHVKPRMKDVPSFTVHDFRRTARSHLSALGVDPHIAERCLNHKIKGVAGIYDRHAYFDERKVALSAWAGLLAALEAGERVVPIKRAA